jgi:hypothetical protein
MRELEGRTYPEIAETLGVTVPAVEALIARARKSLRLQQAAFRGLAVIQLPRKLLEPGDVAGSAIGASAVAKVAAVLVAGVVASSVGSAPTVKAETPQHAVVKPRVEQGQSRAPVSAPTYRHHSKQRVGLRTPPAIVPPHLSPATPDAAGSPAPPTAPPAASSDPSSAAPVSTAPAAAASIPAGLPLPQTPAPPPPIELPPLPEPPPVALPDLPPPPPLPLP